MTRIFRQIGSRLDPELADLAIKSCLAGQADRAAELGIIFVELASGIEVTARVAAGYCEFVGPPAQTFGAGAGSFEPDALQRPSDARPAPW